MLLARSEDSKTLSAIEEVCRRAADGIGAHTFIGLQDVDIAVLQRAHARLKTGQFVARRPPADARVLS